MIRILTGAFTVPEIRKKIGFALLMLALYRIGAQIPVPGVSSEGVKALQESASFQGGGALQLLNVFSGGALSQIAIFALGIMPYITASIVLQLLQVVVPSLEKLKQEGEIGQQRITQYTRYLTVALAAGQSVAYVFLFKSLSSQAGEPLIADFGAGRVFMIAVSLTAGAMIVMWMGELITQRGIGNGMSLMIFASIVSGLPSGVSNWWQSGDQVFKVIMPFLALGIIAAVVFIQEGQRRIPIQYAKRVIGRRMSGGGQTYLPLKVNMANVIPVIFAASIMSIPPTIAQFVTHDPANGVQEFLRYGSWAYVAGETLFIILFTYFYTAVTFNPVEQADNLKKYGGFIPGVRPGRPTAEFLDRVLARLTFPGALYLAAVAALPTILFNQTTQGFAFGGTSLLIVVGVALDTVKQVEAQLMMRNYEGFLK
ncbi:preprotein translocase subunit SecY [Patulibacter defluvii]|uniref:preprotein translocase subunit SecY n=1 Tax=Patulibacter defluvii TaxID=3095358 RepID=UPI002A74B850|nr:preprotein translocase subunit SecY [Patulibacter sp. DM4]